ncbi:unnamed protein product [Moneuplotes crassus]|uniref:Uncharacterized protein n=1 Tax=Euplotes crassus TaxID=5936 RepID=A0AAD1Y4Z1_EUPCR|nr:unnamed protein product [Moneuplotes crassus]
MELKSTTRRTVNKEQLRQSQRNRNNMRQRTNRIKKASRRNILSLTRDNQSLMLSRKLRKIVRCKKNKIQNVQDLRNVIRSLVSPKRSTKQVATPPANTKRDKRRRILSAGRCGIKHSEEQREQNLSMIEYHQNMISRINKKLEQNKIINGRFCSPLVLRQKATNFQTYGSSSKSISDDSSQGDIALPKLNKVSP